LGATALAALGKAVQRRVAGDKDPVESYWFFVDQPVATFDLEDPTRRHGTANPGVWYLAVATYEEWIHMREDQSHAWIPAWAAKRAPEGE
jgi:hypothetical protein